MGHFMAVSFSNISIPSAVLVRMTWLDGRGKASGLQRSVECGLEAQQSEYNTKVKLWCSRHQDACLIAGFYKKEIESQRVETALYLYLLVSISYIIFSKIFPLSTETSTKRNTISHSNWEKSHHEENGLFPNYSKCCCADSTTYSSDVRFCFSRAKHLECFSTTTAIGYLRWLCRGGRHYAQLEKTHASLSVAGGWSMKY